MKIDSPNNIWDLSVTPQDWIDRESMAAIYQNFSTSDLRKEIVGTGIEKTVLVQTVTNYDETPLLLALAEKDDLVAGVVGWLDIDSKDAISHLERYLTLPGASYLKSIRDIAQDHPDSNYLARPQAIATVKELSKFGIAYDLLTKTPELPGAIEMVRQAPETNFIMDHISKPYIAQGTMEPWNNLIKELASFENVVCKVSGLVTEAKWHDWKSEDFKPYFEILVESFGVDRLMFGSDWPVCTLSGSYEEVVNLAQELTKDFSQSEQKKFWGDVAVSAYKLTP